MTPIAFYSRALMVPPRNVRSAWSGALRLAALVVTSALATTRCASGACDLNSDCNAGTYCGYDNQCRYDCFEDRDCNDGSFCNRDRGRCQAIAGDAGVTADVAEKKDGGVTPVDAGPPRDAGVDVPVVTVDVPVVMDVPVVTDVGSPPVDLGGPVDVPVTPVDTGTPPGRGAYLDPCMVNEDCASGECLRTSGGARFCTRRCVATLDCADGFLCSRPGGRCVLDDTGTACDTTSTPCARVCLGNNLGHAAHCTHECNSAADCPAGFGCQDVGGGQRMCVSAEQPCGRADDCTSSLCLNIRTTAFNGCTNSCVTARDCPRRMTYDLGSGVRYPLPPYDCVQSGADRICVPPVIPIDTRDGAILASDALGAPCSESNNGCRSGVCDTAEGVCVQGCTPTSGCPSGFNCLPWQPDGTGTAVYLACRRALTGSSPVNGTCTRGADCVTGLCLPDASGTTAYCSRYCTDRLCPTGMRCVPDGTAFDGTPLALCLR